jgi:integrase
MCNTGLRPGEARQLKWKDLTYFKAADGEDAVEVFVHASHSRVNKMRTTVGQNTGAEALRRLYESRKADSGFAGPDDYIWCDTDGYCDQRVPRKPFNTLIKAAEVETDSMGKRLAIYSLRHSYITSRVRHGVDKYELAKSVGTSLDMIQQFYDHVTTPEMTDERTKVRSKARREARQVGAEGGDP